mmetsp:Transcript_67983/g.191611  ORF Transcript_67983/g.191611 Transcript_67983/m.191611 type:complete len:205 (+) Transcript_67983:687-1301(+)
MPTNSSASTGCNPWWASVCTKRSARQPPHMAPRSAWSATAQEGTHGLWSSQLLTSCARVSRPGTGCMMSATVSWDTPARSRVGRSRASQTLSWRASGVNTRRHPVSLTTLASSRRARGSGRPCRAAPEPAAFRTPSTPRKSTGAGPAARRPSPAAASWAARASLRRSSWRSSCSRSRSVSPSSPSVASKARWGFQRVQSSDAKA